MSNIVRLDAWLSTDFADVEIVTPDHAVTITASRYDAAALMQHLERRANLAGALAGFVEAHKEGE